MARAGASVMDKLAADGTAGNSAAWIVNFIDDHYDADISSALSTLG